MGQVVACAGAVVCRDDGRILVIQRAHAPSQGLWSIPGGRIEAGETPAEAARREVREETGLEIDVAHLLGRVLLPAGNDVEYDVSDFLAAVVGDPDAAVAGDDAADVRWVTRAQFLALPTSPGLGTELEGWQIWAAAPGTG